MKTVIFSNSTGKLNKVLSNKTGGKIYYLVLSHSLEISKLIEFMENDNSRFVLVEDFKMQRKLSGDFQTKFINFVAGLNKVNHSLFWWCLNFTNKNPMTTQFCNRVYQILTIIDLVENNDFNEILVVTEDRHLLRQSRIYAKDKQIRIINALSTRLDLKSIIKGFSPLAVIFAFLRSLVFAIHAKSCCSLKFDAAKKYAVVLSMLSQQYFTKRGQYRDPYFGEFVYFLKKKNIDFLSILIVIDPHYRRLLKKACSQESGIPVVTAEYFLKIPDLIRCLYHSLIKYCSAVRVRGRMDIEGIDLSYLVKVSIRNDYISSYFYDNLKIYYAIKALSKMAGIDRFFYPFENRSFEKIIITSLRRYSPGTRIAGYQHASLSLRHTNFLLGEEEYKITPLPDIVKTFGDITREFMENTGNFPEDLLQTGCALRQGVFEGGLKKKKARISNILIALATDLEEYIKVLNFLNKAAAEMNAYRIWIRPHPVFSLEDAIKITGKINFKFYKADQETLEECYTWADLVLYVHSTLSIEAILRGIPIFNIMVPNPLDPDPLFNFSDFRWRIEKPEDLLPMIHYIDGMKDSDFLLRQRQGRDYAKRYILEPNENRLEEFYSIRKAGIPL